MSVVRWARYQEGGSTDRQYFYVCSTTSERDGITGMGAGEHAYCDDTKLVYLWNGSAWGSGAPLASPTFTGTVTLPTPFTLGATSVTATGTELNRMVGVTSGVQAQLDAKQATLVSATNIKTINGSSLLGSGDMSISGSGLTQPQVMARGMGV